MNLPMLPPEAESGWGAERSAEEMRGKIMELEGAIQALPLEQQLHIEPTHRWVPGIYMREIRIPKGTLLTGAIHKTEHLCILSEGDVSVYTEGGVKRLKASAVIHSLPGIKRALYAHEDSIWINVHHNPDNLRDLDAIDRFYTADTFEEALPGIKRACLEGGA